MYYKKINVMCPTYGRAGGKLHNFVSSCMKKAADKESLRFTFMLHEGDAESEACIKSLVPESQLCLLYENEDTCNLSLFFNRMYEETDFSEPDTAVSLFGDDMVFITKGWDKIMLDKLNDSCGLGIVYGDDDNVQHGDNCVYFITSRRLVNYTDKPFMCPAFKVEWIDTIWYEIGKNLNLLEYLPNLHIAHRHSRSNEVGFDQTFMRMRGLAEEADNQRDIIPEYVETSCKNIERNLKARSDISVIMTAYDRLFLLRKTISSLKESVGCPEIKVYDDGSVRAKQVQKVTEEAGFVFVENLHLGCEKHHRRVFDREFANKNIKWVVVIDSDSVLYKFWYVKVCDMVDGAKAALAGLFNKGDRNSGNIVDGYEEKEGVGGIGMMVSRTAYNLLPKTDPEKNGWDNQICKAVLKEGHKIIATERSYIQHTGYVDGIHANDRFDENVAKNFCGDIIEESPSEKIIPGQKILVSCMAREEDVIYAAVIVHCLINAGVKVVWLTIPRYTEIIECLAPTVTKKVIEPYSGNPQDDYSEISTYRMEEIYPGYDGYINLQMSSRELRGLYRSSDLQKLEWLKRRVMRYTDISLDSPVNLLQGVRLAQRFPSLDGEKVFVSGLNGDDNDVEKIWSEHCGNPNALLVCSERRHNIREGRRNQRWGLSYSDMLSLLKDADKVKGNDSWLTILKGHSCT